MKIIKRVLFLFLAAFVLLVPASAIADDESAKVEEKKEYIGRVQLQAEKYPLEHYRIETQVGDGLMETGDRALSSLNSGLWSINKTIASISIYFINTLMTFDFINTIGDEVSVMSERIYNAMSGAFVGLFLTISGGIAYYRFHVSGQAGSAIKGFIGALVILVCTYWFYDNTDDNIRWMNDISAQAEGVALSANVWISSGEFENDKQPDKLEGTAILSNQLFDLMVKRPYLLFNYGTTKESEVLKEDPNRIDKLLSAKPYTDEGKTLREEIVTKEVKTHKNYRMSPEYNGERFGNILMTIIISAAVAVPAIAMASLKCILQFMFLGVIIFAPVPLTLSLIPSMSDKAAGLGKALFSLVVQKFALSLIIAVSVSISALIYETVKVTNGFTGYAMICFIIVLTTWSIFKYRNEILSLSMGVAHPNRTAERITQSASHTAKSTAKQAASAGINLTKRMASIGAESIRGKSKYRENENSAESQELDQKRQGLTVVNGGLQGKRSKDRETGVNSINGAELHKSPNLSDKQSQDLSLSRKETSTLNGQNESQNSAASTQKPLEVKNWQKNRGLELKDLEMKKPSEHRQPELQSSTLNPEFQQPGQSQRSEVPEQASEKLVSPARSEVPEQVSEKPVSPARSEIPEQTSEKPISPARSENADLSSLYGSIPADMEESQAREEVAATYQPMQMERKSNNVKSAQMGTRSPHRAFETNTITRQQKNAQEPKQPQINKGNRKSVQRSEVKRMNVK